MKICIKLLIFEVLQYEDPPNGNLNRGKSNSMSSIASGPGQSSSNNYRVEFTTNISPPKTREGRPLSYNTLPARRRNRSGGSAENFDRNRRVYQSNRGSQILDPYGPPPQYNWSQYRSVFPYTTLQRGSHYPPGYASGYNAYASMRNPRLSRNFLTASRNYNKRHSIAVPSMGAYRCSYRSSKSASQPPGMRVFDVYDDPGPPMGMDPFSPSPYPMVPHVVYLAPAPISPMSPYGPSHSPIPSGNAPPSVSGYSTRSMPPQAEKPRFKVDHRAARNYRKCLVGWMIGLAAVIVVALSLALFIQGTIF